MDAIRKQALHISITVVLIVAGITAAALVATQSAQPPSFTLELIIFLTGAAGGVANNYRRLMRMPVDMIEAQSIMASQLITFQIYISPLAGGIFAAVLYLIFMSGFLQGTFFPAFDPVMKDGYESFRVFSQGANPATNQDTAKAILWAFIAGFSEGLVPNFIDKILREVTHKERSEEPQRKKITPSRR